MSTRLKDGDESLNGITITARGKLVHEDILDGGEMFDAVADVAKKEQRSRDGAGANVKHPDTKRTQTLLPLLRRERSGHGLMDETRRPALRAFWNSPGPIGFS
jgi:hypothetical protein